MEIKSSYNGLEIRESGGRVYSHIRADSAVAVLVYRRKFCAKKNSHYYEILLRKEPYPHGVGFSFVAGMMDKNISKEKTAIEELVEEAGLEAPEGELYYLGNVGSGKYCDLNLHLFALDYRKAKQRCRKDVDAVDSVSTVEWVKAADAYKTTDSSLIPYVISLTKEKCCGLILDQVYWCVN